MPSVALIDTRVHPLADEFYRRCPDEAIGATGTMHVDSRVPLPGMTLESLLTSMATLAAGGGALVVQHGTPEGLSMQLIPGAQPLVPARGRERAQYVLADARSMGVLADAPGSGALMTVPDAEAATLLNISVTQVASLRALMRRVQGLRLAHVALRACNIGQNSANMDAIKRFFGAQRLSAPDQPDSHGTGNVGSPTTSAGAWASWRRAHPHRHEYTDAALGGTFAVSPNRQHVAIAMMADSWTVAERWVGAHLPAGAWQGQGSTFIWHALWWGLPPTFSGEPAYRTHIITV
ncbi:hypothetical protein ACMHYB_54350 [Sorangium sp. So ce1128]